MTEFDKTYGHLIAILESYSGSADDARYMELAKDPEKNKAELQRMVDRKAVSSGFKGPFEHGTRENFNVFSNDRIGSRYGKDRKGFFFTHIGGVASDTSALNPETLQMDEKSKLIHVYLQMENPFTDSHLQKMIGRKIRYYADGNDDSVYMDASDAFDNNRHGIMEYVERNGMDSIFLRGGDLAVVFSPGQIKLADPMTYDDNGNVIPLSLRFNSSSVDIRENTMSGDERYMMLAKDPESNKVELQRMVDEKAEKNMPWNKLRDSSTGKMIVLQHDTTKDFNKFIPGGVGIWKSGPAIWLNKFGSEGRAAHNVPYHKPQGFKRLKLYADVSNPLIIDNDTMLKWAQDVFAKDETPFKKQEFPYLLEPITIRRIQDAGYNGIEYNLHNNYEVIVFDPNLIKSADLVTYDDKGNIIPLSKRFNERSDDIRESSELPDRLRNDIDDLAISKTIEPALQELFRKYIRADRKAEAANDYNTPSGNAGKRSASTRKFRELSKEYSRLHPEDTARQGLIDQHTKFMKTASDEYRDAVEGVEMSIAKTDLNESENDDYRGNHQAPMSDSGSPLHDLSGTYPDDIYSNMGARYYGHYGDSRDMRAINIIQAYRNHPSRPITIYRAVPYESSHAEKISRIEADMKDVLKYGTRKYHKDTYDILYKDLAKLKAETPVGSASKAPDTINVGDWVTIDRKYAREHGEGVLNGKYRIVSKTVRARDIFTNGDSIFEFGYDPQ